MNDRTIVQHPNGYSGVLMGKSTMMIYDKDDNCVLHTCFRTPNTEKELYEVLETMPRFIEILASVEADRKTENSSEKPNNCETCANGEGDIEACGYCRHGDLYEPKTEPTISKMEQVEDEFKQFDREALILLIECQKERIAELLAKDEPQTDEPTWEQVKEYCNKRCLDIVDSALRKQWYKDEPQNGYQTFNGTSVYVSRIEDEPQTDNGIGCSRCEGRYDCYDRDMPNAVHCNNYGKVTDEPQIDWNETLPCHKCESALSSECTACDGQQYFRTEEGETDCPWK